MAEFAPLRSLLHDDMTSDKYSELEARIGYSFTDRTLLDRALTHASAVVSAGKSASARTYERLEFLGDRVLGLVIADMLMTHFPEESEGELSRRLARLVNADTCTGVAQDIDLDSYIRTADGLSRIGRRAADGIRADACEALIGAIYHEAGFDISKTVVAKLWRDRVDSMTGPLRDAKTELQEWSHKRGLGTPRYEVASVSGPDHEPDFTVTVILDKLTGESGHGKSKREAEQEAARAVLEREHVWSGGDA